MTLNIIYSVYTPNGITFLAYSDKTYYIKGEYTPVYPVGTNIADALANYVGVLFSIIERHCDDCYNNDCFGCVVKI